MKINGYAKNCIIWLIGFFMALVMMFTMLYSHERMNHTIIAAEEDWNEFTFEKCHIEQNEVVTDAETAYIIFPESYTLITHVVIQFTSNRTHDIQISAETANSSEELSTVDVPYDLPECEIQTHSRNAEIGRLKIVNKYHDRISIENLKLRCPIFTPRKAAVTALFSILFATILVVLYNRVSTKKEYLKRESNFELGRVIMMLLLIAHHCSIHGKQFIMDYMGQNRLFALFLIPAGKIAFVFFIATSCWFLQDQSFSPKHFIRTWLEVLFYNIVFTAAAIPLGVEFNRRNLWGVFFPVIGYSHGFAASYLAFYLLLPFLKIVQQKLNLRKTDYLILLLLIIEVFSQIIGVYDEHVPPFPNEIAVFILCYFIAYRLKNWPIKYIYDKWLMINIVVAIWLLLWMLRYTSALYPSLYTPAYLIATMTDESSITNIIAGFALFFFIREIRLPKMPFINYLSQGTFACLLIHDHEFFRYVIWDKFFCPYNWFYSKYYLLLTLGTVITVFTFTTAVDRFRVRLLERRILSMSIIDQLCIKWSSILEE
jgi:hypothetical protein